MGHHRLDSSSQPGILKLELHGSMSLDDMRAMVVDFSNVMDALRGAPFRVFCDLRNMSPLSPEASAFFQASKALRGAAPNFHGSAVLVASPVVAMQHRRTSVEAGISETELISDDEAACWEHLRRVHRARR